MATRAMRPWPACKRSPCGSSPIAWSMPRRRPNFSTSVFEPSESVAFEQGQPCAGGFVQDRMRQSEIIEIAASHRGARA